MTDSWLGRGWLEQAERGVAVPAEQEQQKYVRNGRAQQAGMQPGSQSYGQVKSRYRTGHEVRPVRPLLPWLQSVRLTVLSS